MARARTILKEIGKAIAKGRKERKAMANKVVVKIIMGTHWHLRHLMEEKFAMLSTHRVAGVDAEEFTFAESLGAMAITVHESMQNMRTMRRNPSDYIYQNSQHVGRQQDLERR